MYQQQPQGASYGFHGATKLNRPGAGTGFDAGSMNASMGSAAYGGGYTGYAAWGGGSNYGQSGLGSMMGGMQEEIVVTKLFSSRRDLDRLASSQDFSRRFNSNWGSYLFAGADGYGGSLYGVNSAAGGSLINSGGGADTSFFGNQRTGAAGIGPNDHEDPGIDSAKENGINSDKDGAGAAGKKQATKTMVTQPKKTAGGKDDAGREIPSRDSQLNGVVNSIAPKLSDDRKQDVVKDGSLRNRSEKGQPTTGQSASQTNKSTERSDGSGSRVDSGTSRNSQPAIEEIPLLAGVEGRSKEAPNATSQTATVRIENGSGAPKTHSRTAEPIDDIPLLAEDVRPLQASAAPTTELHKPTELPAGDESMQSKSLNSVTQAEMPKEAAKASQAVNRTSPTNPTKRSSGNGESRQSRPRSRQPVRPTSRLSSTGVVEFPEAQKMPDDLVNDDLSYSEKRTSINAKQARGPEDAVGVERQRPLKAIEEAQKRREEEAQMRRKERESEQQQRKELLAKLDEERKRERDAAVAERERQREEEKLRFEEMKRTNDEREATRISTVIAERQRPRQAQGGEAQGKQSRSVSRQRNRRPPSRPASTLRGAIPEQPPELVAGQIQDTLASDTLVTHPQYHNEAHHPHSEEETQRTVGSLPEVNRTTHSSFAPGAQHAAISNVTQPPPSQAAVVSRAHRVTPATPLSQSSRNTRPSRPNEHKAESTTARNSLKPSANMVKTLVLVEEIREGNHALTLGDQSVSYKDHTIGVTEVKTRPEGNFNYQSSVVHDVGDAVCNGYNAAVLAIDAPNTAGRFESPVWSILNRIIRRLLQENSNSSGELRADFELTCAFGYLHKDKVKDLLTASDTEAPFTKVSVNPSPIYGPRLTNLTYDTVTDPSVFEDVLTSTLSRASEDATLNNLTEGVLAAFVLIMQTRETDGKSDVYLSSLVVATSGEDTFPYQSAISHTRNEYATVFHLVLGGPSCTCFMLNIADDDAARGGGDSGEESLQEKIVRLLTLLQDMTTLQNYDLRSGSVKRFIKYVELSHTNALARLEKEQDEAQRRKVERYLREQERLLQDAYRLLQGASIK